MAPHTKEINYSSVGLKAIKHGDQVSYSSTARILDIFIFSSATSLDSSAFDFDSSAFEIDSLSFELFRSAISLDMLLIIVDC
jgi:hypothetical protein